MKCEAGKAVQLFFLFDQTSKYFSHSWI